MTIQTDAAEKKLTDAEVVADEKLATAAGKAQTKLDTAAALAKSKKRPLKDVTFLIRKWGATIMFILFVVAHGVTITRLFDQNERLEQLVIENRILVSDTANFFERTLDVECAIRQEARITVRDILFNILDEFPPSETIEHIRTEIATDFPEIVCSDVISSPEGTGGTLNEGTTDE